MSPLDPAELSALLDGELSPARAEEVRCSIAADPALRAVYDRLVGQDAQWKAGAAQLTFQPQATLGRGLLRRRLRGAALVLGVVGFRLGLKLAPAPLEFAVALLGFALVAGWGVSFFLRATEEDCARLASHPLAPPV
jgi:anti-sigma factor RsiW